MNIQHLNNMTEEQELGIAQSKGELIRNALLIIDKLANSSIADCDGCDIDSDEFLILQDLVIKARGIKRDSWWQHLVKVKK